MASQPSKSSTTADAERALCARMMQLALNESPDDSIEALHVYRFQALGLLKNVRSPEIAAEMADVLRDPEHASRVTAPPGPSVYVLKADHVEAVEVAPLLLHEDAQVRIAALEYFKGAADLAEPWLTPETAEVVKKRVEDCHATDLARWRSAGVELVPVLQADFFAHVAGLRQSLVARFEDGVNRWAPRVMRPDFRTLAPIRPAVWSPTAQRQELAEWINEFAALPSIKEAMTAYFRRCGFLPLSKELGMGEVMRQWLAKNPSAEISWEQLCSWARELPTPIAFYHACVVGLQSPWMIASALPAAMEAVHRQTTSASPEASYWVLRRELTQHYTQHIEALHPGQDGERVACYALWLADKVLRALAPNDRNAKVLLEGIVRPERDLSFTRWTVARSLVHPSPLRCAVLTGAPLWAMSLLAEIGTVGGQVEHFQINESMGTELAEAIRWQAFPSPIARSEVMTRNTYAFQEVGVQELLRRDELFPVSFRTSIATLCQIWEKLLDADYLKDELERLDTCSSDEQQLVLTFLKELVFSASTLDKVISEWLRDGRRLVALLKTASEESLLTLIEVLAEFQNREGAELSARLPHTLAYALEQMDDAARAQMLFPHVVLMSLNGAITSPIQRILASKWRADVIGLIGPWRLNLADLSRESPPWVRARMRAFFAVVSRAIGPPSKVNMPSEPAVTGD